MKKLFPSTIFIAALLLLLVTGGRAADNNTKINNDTAQGIVLPDNVYDRQPFSFAVGESVPGAAVTVQSADGVVVQNAPSDKYGRVFLAAGLPAGAYLISKSGQPLGKIDIKHRIGDALQHATQPIQLENPPESLKVSDPFSLAGHGFSPNCANMNVILANSEGTESPAVLAATEDQLKIARVKELKPGTAQLRVVNRGTGQSTDFYPVLLYDIHGTLVRQALHSSEHTKLIINTKPENIALKVSVSVTSGPVDFGDGRKETGGMTRNGQAIFPIHAEHGSGPFQVAWKLAELPRGLALPANNVHIPGAALTAVSEALFPDGYISSPRFDAYHNLLNAKRDWLERRVLSLEDAINDEKKRLNLPGNEDNKEGIQSRIDSNTAELNAAKDELKTLDGKDEKAKKALVKKNVEMWASNLDARIRELHKIEQQEKKLAEDANNKQDRERHEANAKDAADEAQQDAKEATDLRSDLEKAKL